MKVLEKEFKLLKLKILGLVTISLIAAAFAVTFARPALADCSTSSSGSDDTVTCDSTTTPNISTGNGDDTISTNDTATTFISSGNDNDVITVDNSIVGIIGGGNGDDSISVDQSLVGSVNGGGGNDTLVVDDALGPINLSGGGGNDSIAVDHAAVLLVTGDNGDDTISLNQGAVLVAGGGDGNDDITIGNSLVGAVGGGNDDDSVTLLDGALVAGTIHGGDGFDTLKFKFKVGSQDEKDAFQKLLDAQDANSGYIEFDGHTYYWDTFEALRNLLYVAQGHGEATVVVLSDSRLNQQDVAAPVAVYCKSGHVEVWVIDPNTGNGDKQLDAPITSFPTSNAGIDASISGDQGVISYGGYTYTFPLLICP